MVYFEVPKEEFIWIRRIMIHTLTSFLSKEEWEKSQKLGSLLEKFLPPLLDKDGNPSKKDTQWIAEKHLYLANSLCLGSFAADVILHPKCRKHIFDEEDMRFVAYIKEKKESNDDTSWIWVKEEK